MISSTKLFINPLPLGLKVLNLFVYLFLLLGKKRAPGGLGGGNQSSTAQQAIQSNWTVWSHGVRPHSLFCSDKLPKQKIKIISLLIHSDFFGGRETLLKVKDLICNEWSIDLKSLIQSEVNVSSPGSTRNLRVKLLNMTSCIYSCSSSYSRSDLFALWRASADVQPRGSSQIISDG